MSTLADGLEQAQESLQRARNELDEWKQENKGYAVAHPKFLELKEQVHRCTALVSDYLNQLAPVRGNCNQRGPSDTDTMYEISTFVCNTLFPKLQHHYVMILRNGENMGNPISKEEIQTLSEIFAEFPEFILSNGVSTCGWYRRIDGEENVIYMKDKV